MIPWSALQLDYKLMTGNLVSENIGLKKSIDSNSPILHSPSQYYFNYVPYHFHKKKRSITLTLILQARIRREIEQQGVDACHDSFPFLGHFSNAVAREEPMQYLNELSDEPTLQEHK